MPEQDQLFTFLAGLDSAGQEEFIRKQTAASLISLDRIYGYGSATCDCAPIPIPCPEHMARGVLVGRAILNGATGDVGELSDRELFKLAWRHVPAMRKKTRCDCPTLWEPCEHAKAHAAGSVESPLTDAAKLVLLQLVHQVEQVDYPEAQEGTDAATHETKSVPMAKRHDAGYGVQSKADFVSRELPTEQKDRFRRDGNNGPNGQPDPGPVQLQIYEEPDDYDSPEYDPVAIEGPEPKMGRCWACRFAVLDGSECPDCKRARQAMAKTMGRKKRKRAV